MLGHEHVLGDDRVAAGALHAGHEPGVLDRQIGHRHQRQPEVGHLAALVLHVDAARRPLRVQRIPTPTAIARSRASRRRPASPRRAARASRRPTRRGLRSQMSCCARSGKSAGEPGADVDQARHPRRRSAAAAELGHHRRCRCGCRSRMPPNRFGTISRHSPASFSACTFSSASRRSESVVSALRSRIGRMLAAARSTSELLSNSQRPTSNAQPLPTCKRQLPTTSNPIGNWALGVVGSWKLVIGSCSTQNPTGRHEAPIVAERLRHAAPCRSAVAPHGR